MSARFLVLAMARTATASGWSVVIQFWDHDRTPKQHVIRASDLVGDGLSTIRRLADEGLQVDDDHDLIFVLRKVKTPTRARLVTRGGWNDGIYTLGREAFGPDGGEPVVFDGIGDAPPPIGTVAGWREKVARVARGNSRLVVAISLAFVGPLLRPLDIDGFGIHLRGNSSIGKTTALHVARSVTGLPAGSWRATINGLEGEALAANDNLMTLDELSEVDAFTAGPAAYMLANGKGKARADQTGAGRPRVEWRTVFLSTGETTLADKIAEDGRRRRTTAGQTVRLIEVAAEAGRSLGLFEDIHGAGGPAEFAKALRQAVDQESGTAFREFLERFLANRDAALADRVEPVRRAFRLSAPSSLDAQAARVRDHFGVIAACGELATSYGITGWEVGESTRAAEAVFGDWLSARGEGGHEDREAIAAVQRYVQDVVARGNHFGSCWKEDVRNTECFCITTQEWRDRVCQGFNADNVAATLFSRDLLVADEGRRQAKVRREGSPMNVYAVKAEILDWGP